MLTVESCKRWILAALLAVSPLVANAGGDTGAVVISGSLLQIISNGTQQIAYLYVPVTGSGCSSPSAVQLTMDSSNPMANSMYATLLTAKTSGQAVDIATNGCNAGGVPIMISIYLES